MAKKRKISPEVSDYFRQLGLKYGSAGGKKAAANLTPEQLSERMKRVSAGRAAISPKRRKEIARKAAETRWGKKESK